MGTLQSLTWVRRFLDETPGDSVTGGPARQVPHACWSRVEPSPAPNPELLLWSSEMGAQLGLDTFDEVVLGGGQVVEGMDIVKTIEGCQKLPGDRPKVPQQIIRCTVVE